LAYAGKNENLLVSECIILKGERKSKDNQRVANSNIAINMCTFLATPIFLPQSLLSIDANIPYNFLA
jgi:hypothetical protein